MDARLQVNELVVRQAVGELIKRYNATETARLTRVSRSTVVAVGGVGAVRFGSLCQLRDALLELHRRDSNGALADILGPVADAHNALPITTRAAEPTRVK